MDNDIMRAIDQYHILYEKARIWDKTSWLGVPCWKLPMDAFVIQELIVKQKPDFIVETGTGKGGSAMFYASICEMMGHGKVITVDIKVCSEKEEIIKYPCHKRIEFISGGSTNPLVVDKVLNSIGTEIENPNCMVILDSWHSMDHVYEEMFLYKELVPVGGYMIVEDSHAAGNPVPWEHEDLGPMGAIDKFLMKEFKEWEIDWDCERHLMTFNPKGYLQRIGKGE